MASPETISKSSLGLEGGGGIILRISHKGRIQLKPLRLGDYSYYYYRLLISELTGNEETSVEELLQFLRGCSLMESM